MSPQRKKILLILAAVAVFDLLTAAGLYFWWKSGHEQARFPDEKERAELSTKISVLGWTVDGYLSRQEVPPSGDDAELLRQAAAHDPSLLAEDLFAPYLLKVQVQQQHAVLLLCTKDGSRAVIEDAGCSLSTIERQARDEVPCAFTLRVSEGCQVR